MFLYNCTLSLKSSVDREREERRGKKGGRERREREERERGRGREEGVRRTVDVGTRKDIYFLYLYSTAWLGNS